MKKRFLLFSLIIVFNLSACTMGTSNETNNPYSSIGAVNGQVLDSGPVRGGTINLFSTKPDTLNPLLTNNIYVQDFSSLIFEGLVKLDQNQKPVAELAEKWDVSPDGLTWTFKIRSGVNWHDDQELSSDDVEFTLDLIKNSNLNINPNYKNNVQNIATFAAIDRSTFRVMLKSPDSFTAEKMTFPIIPKHYFYGQDMTLTPRNMSPIGTGPYKFDSYNNYSDIILVRNDNWWNSTDNGKGTPKTPYIDKVDIKTYANRKDAIGAFQSKNVDVIALDKEESNRYNGRMDLLVKKYPNRSFDFIAMNLSRPPFTNKNFRHALAYGIDKVKIINDVLSGEAIASDFPVMPDTWFYDSEIISYTPDKYKAMDLLAQNRISTPLELTMLVNKDNPNRLKVAEEIQAQLKDIGINLVIKNLDYNSEMNQIKYKRYDMALLGANIPTTPDISFMYASSAIGAMNASGYRNPTVDSYLAQLATENDNDRKKGFFINAKEIINEEVPYIGLYFYYNEIVANKKIRGDINPCLWDKYNNFANWYISSY